MSIKCSVTFRLVTVQIRQQFYPFVLVVEEGFGRQAKNFKKKDSKKNRKLGFWPALHGSYTRREILAEGDILFNGLSKYPPITAATIYFQREEELLPLVNPHLFKLSLGGKVVFEILAPAGYIKLGSSAPVDNGFDYLCFSNLEDHVEEQDFRRILLLNYGGLVEGLTEATLAQFNLQRLASLQSALELAGLRGRYENRLFEERFLSYFHKHTAEDFYRRNLERLHLYHYLAAAKTAVAEQELSAFKTQQKRFWGKNYWYEMQTKNGWELFLWQLGLLYNPLGFCLFNELFSIYHNYPVASWLYLSGASLTFGMEWEKTRDLFICGVRLKKNSRLERLSLEQKVYLCVYVFPDQLHRLDY